MANVPFRCGGQKLFGAFIQPVDGSFTLNALTQVKASIDLIAGLGGNLMMYFSECESVVQSGYSQSQFLINHDAAFSYAAKKGVWMLPYVARTFSAWGGASANISAMATAGLALARLAAKYENCVGISIIDEAYQSGPMADNVISEATCASNVNTLYGAIKPYMPADFPVIGTSCPAGAFVDSQVFDYSGGNVSRVNAVAASCDLFSFDVYYAASYSDSATLRGAFLGKQLAIPGAVYAKPNPLVGTVAGVAAALMGMIDGTNVNGFGWFILADFDPDTWGLYASDYVTARTTKTTAFTANNTGTPFKPSRVAPHLYRRRMLVPFH